MKKILNRPNPAEHTGEIRFEAGQELLVMPHADLAKAWPQDAYLNTIPSMPLHEVVLAYAKNHPQTAAKRRTEPLWATLCGLLGGTLCMAVGLFFILLGLLS